MRPSPTLKFFQNQWRLLFFGFLLAFFSSLGQTFFISLFSQDIRDEFVLSHGEFGTIYAIGTIASAVTIIFLGQLADIMRLRMIATIVIVVLAGAAAFFSLVSSIATLIIGIFLLRLSGQGMMSHLYTTAISRRFNAERGRALSVAIFGHPASEFIMPVLVISLLLMFNWRQVWQITAFFTLLVMLPAVYTLIPSRKKQNTNRAEVDTPQHDENIIHWTRKQMLTHWRFWMLIVLILAPSFTSTGLFFHQIYFAEIKNIPIEQWAAGYGFFAIFSIFSSFSSGFLVDKFSARRLAPVALLPLSFTIWVLYITTPGIMVWIFFSIYGIAQGASYTIITPLWAEIYGTKHLGSIRAITQSLMVFASALSPVMLGLMIDVGLSLELLLLTLGFVPTLASGMAFIATYKLKD